MTIEKIEKIGIIELADNLKVLLNKEPINKSECLLELTLLMSAVGIKNKNIEKF